MSPDLDDGTAKRGEETVCELRVPAEASRLKLIRRLTSEAAQTLGCSPAATQDLVGAVDEACQNIIRHAYKDGPKGDILVRIGREGGDLIVRLIDFADPVDPDQVRPRPLDELRPGGLGTRLIHAAVDAAEFEPPAEGAGNVLKLVKRIG